MGLQHPHALGSDDDEGLRPRGPGYTPRAAILALRASRVPDYFLPLPAVPPRARIRHPHWTAAAGRANQRRRGALAGDEVSRELRLREDVWAARGRGHGPAWEGSSGIYLVPEHIEGQGQDFRSNREGSERSRYIFVVVEEAANNLCPG